MSNDNNKVKLMLDGLALRNRDANYVNKDLYRMLYREEMYVMAYETIRVNQGAGTLGTAKTGIDGTNMVKIRKVIQSLKNDSFKPRPCRRTYILKDNGKQRPLGLPDFEEKLVQQAVTRILECIYDSPHVPSFIDESHGFRKGRSCHSALKQVYAKFSGCNYVIKADVKGFFDNVDHDILINLLRKKIKDERFLQLIWKFLRAGIMVKGINGRYSFQRTFKGTPQGGIISPILANIYLHEFDQFIINLKDKHHFVTKQNSKYQKVQRRKLKHRMLLRQAKKGTELYRRRDFIVRSEKMRDRHYPSRKTYDVKTNKFQLCYVRYADDWLLGIRGSIEQSKFIFEECEKFFKSSLKLDWNSEKSYVSRAYDRFHEFLGVNVCFTKPSAVKFKYRPNRLGRVTLAKTVFENQVTLRIPTQKVLHRLFKKGYLTMENGTYRSKHFGQVFNMNDYDIGLHYQSVINGIVNYYRFASNIHGLNYIAYLLSESMMKSLAGKYKSSVSKMFKKFGKPIKIKRADNKKVITIEYNPRLKRSVKAFSTGTNSINWNTIFFKGRGDTKSFLKHCNCCICKSDDRVQIHHANHIKRRGVHYGGFHKVMGAINRKQIPVCTKCHRDIHAGRYDGIPLKKLADTIMINLGIVKPKTT